MGGGINIFWGPAVGRCIFQSHLDFTSVLRAEVAVDYGIFALRRWELRRENTSCPESHPTRSMEPGSGPAIDPAVDTLPVSRAEIADYRAGSRCWMCFLNGM